MWSISTVLQTMLISHVCRRTWTCTFRGLTPSTFSNEPTPGSDKARAQLEATSTDVICRQKVGPALSCRHRTARSKLPPAISVEDRVRGDRQCLHGSMRNVLLQPRCCYAQVGFCVLVRMVWDMRTIRSDGSLRSRQRAVAFWRLWPDGPRFPSLACGSLTRFPRLCCSLAYLLARLLFFLLAFSSDLCRLRCCTSTWRTSSAHPLAPLSRKSATFGWTLPMSFSHVAAPVFCRSGRSSRSAVSGCVCPWRRCLVVGDWVSVTRWYATKEPQMEDRGMNR